MPTDSLFLCIYCKTSKPGQLFDTEHVLPQAFGKFAGNFTLVNVVCQECNQYFGDTIDLELGKGTMEGVKRFEHGIKRPHEFSRFSKNISSMQIAEGEWKGLLTFMRYSKERGDIVLDCFPQIGFRLQGKDEYQFFKTDSFPSKEQLREMRFDSQHDRPLIAVGMSDCEAKVAFSRLGMDFESKGEAFLPPSGEPLECEMITRIDNLVKRALSKIAFNYLARWEGSEFVLQSDFDIIREFIRYDRSVPYPVFECTDTPILDDEPVEGFRRHGHIITINTADDGVSLCAQVSLQNIMKYCVSLSRNYSGVKRDVRRGHFFDINSRKILDVGVRDSSSSRDKSTSPSLESLKHTRSR